jgi:hypothetical protein
MIARLGLTRAMRRERRLFSKSHDWYIITVCSSHRLDRALRVFTYSSFVIVVGGLACCANVAGQGLVLGCSSVVFVCLASVGRSVLPKYTLPELGPIGVSLGGPGWATFDDVTTRTRECARLCTVRARGQNTFALLHILQWKTSIEPLFTVSARKNGNT